ncbi:response regulator transcription factor [Paenibacillus sp. 481]|uniref:response regulator transcription factor n=1 Tax=Paenibacillus sp. 481 TaxID=2835869 RepID=UPI001E4F050C|nr:response regulator transcription factor [Paenibacillus sp. 481]UHA72626.1 response regulator transcription factor [Paenibacillus sp. 481]
MDSRIKVMLLDDHPLMMEALKDRLDREPDIQVVATFQHPRQLLDHIEYHNADVIVMDISMPHMNGFELAAVLKERYGLALKMIMLSGYCYDAYVTKAYEMGVHAYLSKQATYPQIINAIRQSALGHVLMSDKWLTHTRTDKLTLTEREVLTRVAQEMTNKQIACELMMSQRTVEHHLSSMNQKLGVRTRIGAVAKGYELGLLGQMTIAGDDSNR